LTAEKRKGTTSKKAEIKEIWLERTIQFDSIFAMGTWLDMLSKSYHPITWVDWVNKTVTYQFMIYAHNDAEIQRAKESLEKFYNSKIEVVK
jgi:hypothetical protein